MKKVYSNKSLSENPVDLRLVIAGDFCPDGGIEPLCLQASFDTIFDNDMREILWKKDLSIVNLECPLTQRQNPIKKCGPHLAANPSCAEVLKFARFDVAALANNHILDQSAQGLTDTLDCCHRAGIKTVGAGANLSKATEPLFVDVKNQKIAIINICENEFSIAGENSPGAAPIDPVLNFYQFQKTKQEALIILVIVHGGHEYYPLPSPKMVELYRYYVDLGATAVLASHSHVISGFEVYKGCPIFYGLGNFIFDRLKKGRSWHEGILVRLEISRNQVANASIIPYFNCLDLPGVRLMEECEESRCIKSFEEYSRIISDEKLLRSKWNDFCSESSKRYMGSLLMLNQWQKHLFYRGFLPTFHSKKELLSLRNLINCDAHREACVQILARQVNK